MDENLMQVNETPTETAEVESQNVNSVEEVPPTQDETSERLYSRQDVERIMRKRVERSHNSFFKRYGVTDLKGLDDLFDQSKKFKSMQDEYGAIQLKNSELFQENAFLRNNISPERYADIRAYFKGSDIPFTEEALLQALATHPEWVKQQPQVATIKTLGSESSVKPEDNELERAKKFLNF